MISDLQNKGFIRYFSPIHLIIDIEKGVMVSKDISNMIKIMEFLKQQIGSPGMPIDILRFKTQVLQSLLFLD
ncbi:MAG: hypothetical protein ACD_34C00544G0001 [uncultured bacterium]|nr:MAG: hypothetical protein ACD_34C00544G0001 [uncultured bacterium]